MSTDTKDLDNPKEKSSSSPPSQCNNSTLFTVQQNNIEKQLDEFLAKDNYQSKVEHWLKNISPISSPRSFIEKYYNENNPFALDEWTMHWGIDTQKCFSSLITQNTYTPEDNNNEERNWDYMDMRKKQNSDWAHEMTYKGVTLAKSNDYEKAIKVYNHAIEIDPNCVDAYVAKGAAYANQEHYILAIKNFEKALQIDPKCANAKKYLKATQNRKADEDKAKELERKRKEEEERIKRENEAKNDIILDNSKLITSPLFMDMITISPSREDLKLKSKNKRKRRRHHRSRSRNKKKHKKHRSSRSKSHRHNSNKKKRHSRHHSSKYSSDSSSSSSYTSSSDYSSDSSTNSSSYSHSRGNYSDDDYIKEKKSSYHENENDNDNHSESDLSNSSDDHHYSSKRRHSHHSHRSHSKKRRRNNDDDIRKSERKESYSSKHDDNHNHHDDKIE